MPYASQVWIIARQHAGETYAEYMAEGMLDSLRKGAYEWSVPLSLPMQTQDKGIMACVRMRAFVAEIYGGRVWVINCQHCAYSRRPANPGDIAEGDATHSCLR
jgi:hypothetical protein